MQIEARVYVSQGHRDGRGCKPWSAAHPRVGVERAIERDAARGALSTEGQVATIGPCSTRRKLETSVGPAGIIDARGRVARRRTVLDDEAERPYALVEPHVRVQKARLLHGEVVTDGYITL